VDEQRETERFPSVTSLPPAIYRSLVADRQNPASAGFFFCRYNPPAMPIDILLITVLRGLVEVAGMMLLGRGMLWLFGRKARQGNFVYDVLTIGAKPFMQLTRKITPRIVRDSHIPVATFFLLFWIWLGLGMAKAVMCAQRALQCV
jgi:hypothetical protein